MNNLTIVPYNLNHSMMLQDFLTLTAAVVVADTIRNTAIGTDGKHKIQRIFIALFILLVIIVTIELYNKEGRPMVGVNTTGGTARIGTGGAAIVMGG